VRKLASIAVLVGTLVALTATATPAFAAITQPTGTHTAPPDATGKPRPLTVKASGFVEDDLVYIEQCDGTPTSSFGWDPSINCDLGSSPAAVVADASGVATFPVGDVNKRFTPFRGDSPQGLFNCRAPGDPVPTSGIPSYTNCKVRVSTNNTVGTGDQQFFELSLVRPKLNCVLKGALSFNKPLTNVAPKKPKATKVKGDSTVGTDAGTACVNTGAPAAATKYPVTGGTVKIKGSMPSGTTCAGVTSPNLNGTTLKIKWKGINPKKNVLSTAGKSDAVVTGTVIGEFPSTGYVVTTTVVAGAFAGSKLQLQLALNSTVSGAASACAGGSLAGVSYTGTLNVSRIVLL
jgi:hypothetical protein